MARHADATSKFVEFVISEETLSGYLRDYPCIPCHSMAGMESVVNSGILSGASPA